MNANYCQVEQQWRFLKPGEVIQDGDRYSERMTDENGFSVAKELPDLGLHIPPVGRIVGCDIGHFVRPVPHAEPKISSITISSTDSIAESPQKLPVGAYGWIGGPVAGQAADDDFEFTAKAEECRFKYNIVEDAAAKAIEYSKLSLTEISTRTGIPLWRVLYLFSEDEDGYSVHSGDVGNPDWLSEALTVDELARIGRVCGVAWYLVGQAWADSDKTVVDTRPSVSDILY
jgi:hypothetical protein